MNRAIQRTFALILFAGLGFMLGAMFDTLSGGRVISVPRIERHPLPHHVAKHPGGLSLRLAMVHDVIHERFTRHGPAYYEHRNRVVTDELKTESVKKGPDGKPTERYWSLMDDLGAGLGYLGKFGEATALLRDKFKQQTVAGVTGAPLYSTNANLGTFLVIDGIIRGIDNKPGAKELLTEGLKYVHESIRIKPDAHFGREIWQAVIVEFLIAALDKPKLLTEFSMVGNRFDAYRDGLNGDARTYQQMVTREGGIRAISAFLASETSGADHPANRANIRSFISNIGPENGWVEQVPSSHKLPVAFDEPTLGILGMWMLGAGANPHFAVALGEIMLRVGQRHIAWCAYERAVLTADAFLKDAAIRSTFVKHCRKRQQAIEKSLGADEAAKLRPRFNAELAHGQAYQKKYQQYEADRIAAGASIDDPKFYDDFFAKEGRIATVPGDEEWVETDRRIPVRIAGLPPICVFSAGVTAFLAALFIRRRDRKKAMAAARTLG